MEVARHLAAVLRGTVGIEFRGKVKAQVSLFIFPLNSNQAVPQSPSFACVAKRRLLFAACAITLKMGQCQGRFGIPLAPPRVLRNGAARVFCLESEAPMSTMRKAFSGHREWRMYRAESETRQIRSKALPWTSAHF